MNDGIYAYDNSVADSVSGDIRQVIGEIEATLDGMESDLGKLAAGWEGGEHEQYQGIHGRWSNAAEQARGVLAEVQASLNENSQSVIETRGRVINALNG
ncbi:MAG: WXG100 family type VII secretion target [Corynebacterium sp.]|nr:WXG100 family type VII secretion target [Corynebacterium sp.]